MYEHSFWSDWARYLQRWGLRRPAAFVLESAGPLTLLLSQTIYLAQPFMRSGLQAGEWEALAALLENQQESQAFADFLRKEDERH
ncbi:MAG: hypothetical protein RBT34_02000 [Anaerolineaceae bacterium]|jgi:hypothetical protein|nr:hypothetical protein [Anaerolineaceae bacterium]